MKENPERKQVFVPPPRLANEANTSSQGHHREVWCLAVSPSGDHLVSASHDRSLRLWERTREPVILEEEREMVRRAGPGAGGSGGRRAGGRAAGWRRPALTDCSSFLSGARGGVRGEPVQRRHPSGERSEVRPPAHAGPISDTSGSVRRYPERLREKLPRPARRPSRRSKL